MRSFARLLSYVKINRFKFLVVVFIISLGIIFPIIWIGTQYYKTTGDFGFTLYNAVDRLKNIFFTWNILNSTGSDSSVTVLLIPFYTILAFFGILGTSINLKELFLFSSLFIISSVSFFLINFEIADTKHKYIRATASTIFYIFNYFSLFVWSRFTTLIFIPSFCTLLVLLLYKGINTKKYFKYAFLFNLASLAFSISYLNIGYAIPVLFIVIILFIYILLINLKRRDFRGLLIYGFLILLFWIFLNLWWLLPSFFSYKTAYSLQYSGSTINNLDVLNTLSSNFRLRGLILLNNYKTDFSIIDNLLMFFIPLIIAVSILNKFEKLKKYLIFYFILILGLFLMKGIKPPFGGVFLWLFDNVPGFQMFRWASEKFGIMSLLSLSVLFGFGVEKIYELIKWKRLAIVVISLVIIILPINGFQIFTGSFMPNDQKSLVDIPSYYSELKEYLDKDLQQYRIMSFPLIQYYYVEYKWPHGYKSGEDSGIIYNKPVISSRLIGQPENVMPYYLPDTFKNSRAFTQLNSIFNGRYVFINWDRVPYYENDTAKIAYDSMINNTYFEKIGKFGEIDVFRIKNDFYQNQIYSPKRVYTFTEDPEGLIYLLNNSDFINDVKDNAYVFLSQNIDIDDVIRVSNKIIVSKYRNSNADAKYAFEYPFNIPTEGRYEVYFVNETGAKFPDSVSISSPNSTEETLLELSNNNGNISYYGTVSLKIGKYDIKIYSHDKEIEDVEFRKKIFLVLNNSNKDFSSNLEFKKINNTKYIVKIINPHAINLILFSSTFDKKWEIINIEKDGTKIVHLKTNGYSNGWAVESTNNSKEINLIIYYKPQKYFYYGLIISLTTLTCLIAILAFSSRHKKNKI